MTRTHATEFPEIEVPAELLALVAAGQLEDTSWHNDVCPSFTLAADGAATTTLWVDYPDPADRELGEIGMKRFTVTRGEYGGEMPTLFASDDLPELLAYLADRHDIR